MDIALGIDVGGKGKGFHLVALSSARGILWKEAIADASAIATHVLRLAPTVVAIDAPCGWSQGKSRLAERQLAARRVSSFCTPTRAKAREIPGFYGWMFQGEAIYRVATSHLPLFEAQGSVRGRTIEVFPNATVTALRQGPKPQSTSKVRWRRETLRLADVDETSLRNIDFVDAALCALTGLLALEGNLECFGDSTEGILVAPRGIPQV